MSSSEFIVRSYRDNHIAEAKFNEGILESYTETPWEKVKYTGPTGTYVEFVPDKKVFKEMEEGFTFDRVCGEIKNISFLNKGVHFIIECSDGRKTEYFSENGIGDFITEVAAKPIMKKPIISTISDGTDEMEIAFLWTGGPTKFFVFANGLMLPELGSPVTAMKKSVTTFMKKHIGKDADAELTRKGLVCVFNCKVAEPQFSNQTKNSISNKSLGTLATKGMKEVLEEFTHCHEFDSIVDLLRRFQKAEVAADKAREAILAHDKEMEKMRSKKGLMFDKLSDARNLGEGASLLICEGSSARGSAEKGRDKDSHGVFEARGKLINPFTATDEKFFANEEIKLLEYATGLEHGKELNLKKLRYGRVDFFVDPDM